MAANNKELIIAVDNAKECLRAIEFVHAAFEKGWKYHLPHVQTRPIASSLVWAEADMFMVDDEYQRDLDEKRLATTTEFMHKVFIPKAAANGAEVEATVLTSGPDSPSAIGEAICGYIEKTNPFALVIMRQNKGALSRFFMGSVSRYCAVHSAAPVIIVPT